MSMFDLLGSVLGGDTTKQISRSLGADENATSTAMTAILPTLLGALSRNASRPDGAEALTNALATDHDGSVLSDLSSVIQNPDAASGDGILKHVLGNRRQVVENSVARSSGLDAASVAKLMKIAAPLVMGALGQARRQNGLDAGGVASLLDQERQKVEQKAPAQMGILGKLLDADGDGDVDINDIAKHGLGSLGKLFGGR